MAKLSVHIPIFIASASDVEQERNIAKLEIEKIQNEIKWNNIHLSTFHWEWDSRASILRPAQGAIHCLTFTIPLNYTRYTD